MPISYEKLFELMKKKGIKKIDLRKHGIHPTAVNKLSKNQNIEVATIEKICEFLNCQPGDIMEYIGD